MRKGYERIGLSIPSHIKRKIEKLSLTKNLSISEVVRQAIDNEVNDDSDWSILWRALRRMTNQMHELKTLIAINIEATRLSQYYFFAGTPEIPKDQIEEAKQVANKRIDEYMKSLTKIVEQQGFSVETMFNNSETLRDYISEKRAVSNDTGED